MQQAIIPAILSGGAGTRLWPTSTPSRPKQFHSFGGSGSLIAETLRRVAGQTERIAFTAPIIVANTLHADLAAAEARAAGIEPAAIVLEPAARNTAAAAAVAAGLAPEIAPGALVLLLPADHIVADRAAFLAALGRAAAFARERIVTFGIRPTRPETGYGYIKRGAALGEGVFAIEAFKEKPDAATAQNYIADGGYAWNAGMFLFDPALLLREFEAAPDIRAAALASLRNAVRVQNEIRLDAEAFARAPSLPLDMAVMEQTKHGAVVPCDISWADIGAWDEVWRLAAKDQAGNAVQGAAAMFDARGNLLRSEGPKICIAGLDDLIVIATPETVLIVPRDRAQDVKALKQLADLA